MIWTGVPFQLPTPTEVLTQLENINNSIGLQGFFPHFHFGPMPRAEAVRNMRLFAAKCLSEVKSWKCESSFGPAASR